MVQKSGKLKYTRRPILFLSITAIALLFAIGVSLLMQNNTGKSPVGTHTKPNGTGGTSKTKALETLAANHIFASMQYACTNSVYALIKEDGTLTAQGVAMKRLYQGMSLKRATYPSP